MRKVLEWLMSGFLLACAAAIMLGTIWGVHYLVRWTGTGILRHLFHVHALGVFSEGVWWVISVVVLLAGAAALSRGLSRSNEVTSGEREGMSWGGRVPYSAGGYPTAVRSSRPAETAAAPPAAPPSPAAATAPSPSEPEPPGTAAAGELKLELDKPLPIKPPFKIRKDTLLRTDLSDLLDELPGPDAAKSEAPAAESEEAPGMESASPEAGQAETAGEPLPAEAEAAQYVNFSILDATDSAERALELHEGLCCGLDYKLVVSMGMMADPRFATGEQEKIERPPAEKVVLDVVLALEENLEIRNEYWATLEWPESGPSVKNAEFLLRPVAVGPARLKVLMYYQHDLLFCGDMELAVRSEGDEWSPDERPIRWKPLDESRAGQLSLFRRFRDLDREARRSMNISVHRRTPELFDLLVFFRSSGPVPVTWRLRTEISENEIAGYLVRTRLALRLLTKTYEQPETGLYSAERFLDDMSLVGNEIWNKLFGSETGQRLASLLGEEWAPPGAIIQIWVDTRALGFILPWSWLYPLPVIAGKRQNTDITRFWGYRYVVEQLRQLTVDQRPASIVMGEPLRVAGALHNFPAAADERRFFADCSARYAARLAWSEVKAGQWREYLAACDAHLLYFYCHGHTEQPLSPADAEFLRNFPGIAAQSLAETTALMESLTTEQMKKVRGQSAIAIEREILNMTDLGRFRCGDPKLSPVVFLNMCESSEFYPGATENLVDVFLRRGARGVIGTEVPVLAAFGDTFARGFFEAFFAAGKSGEGKEIGMVLWELRRKFLDEGNPLGFIYTYFGDATTRVKPAIIESSMPIEVHA